MKGIALVIDVAGPNPLGAVPSMGPRLYKKRCWDWGFRVVELLPSECKALGLVLSSENKQPNKQHAEHALRSTVSASMSVYRFLP